MAKKMGAVAASLACLFATSLHAADPTKTPSSPAEGQWGGVGLAITVGPAGATVELDAAHGKTDGPLVLDADGRFEVAGTLVRERPGPTRQGDADAPGDPVRYRGRLEGDVLTLEIVLSRTGAVIGPLKAARGATARLRKIA